VGFVFCCCACLVRLIWGREASTDTSTSVSFLGGGRKRKAMLGERHLPDAVHLIRLLRSFGEGGCWHSQWRRGQLG